MWPSAGSEYSRTSSTPTGGYLLGVSRREGRGVAREARAEVRRAACRLAGARPHPQRLTVILAVVLLLALLVDPFFSFLLAPFVVSLALGAFRARRLPAELLEAASNA